MLLYYQITLLVGVIAGGGFIGLYWYNHPGWIRSDVGKLLMTFSIIIFLFYTFNTAVIFWPTMPGRSLIRLVLYTAMTIAIVYRLIKSILIERRIDELVKEPKSDA